MRPFLESSQLCPSTIIVTLNLVKTVLLDKNGKMNQRQDRSGTWLCSKIQWHGKNPPTPERFQVLTIYGHSSLVSSYAKLRPRVKWLLKIQGYKNWNYLQVVWSFWRKILRFRCFYHGDSYWMNQKMPEWTRIWLLDILCHSTHNRNLQKNPNWRRSSNLISI